MRMHAANRILMCAVQGPYSRRPRRRRGSICEAKARLAAAGTGRGLGPPTRSANKGL